MLQVTQAVRKPFLVNEVRVTQENMTEVAVWCQGTICKTEEGVEYIQVRVVKPLNPRQTMAFVGDHVLYANTGYKVYTHKAFISSFDEAGEPACGKTEFTADNAPCVLGRDHRMLLAAGCRSATDYKVFMPKPRIPENFQKHMEKNPTVIPSTN